MSPFSLICLFICCTDFYIHTKEDPQVLEEYAFSPVCLLLFNREALSRLMASNSKIILCIFFHFFYLMSAVMFSFILSQDVIFIEASVKRIATFKERKSYITSHIEY